MNRAELHHGDDCSCRGTLRHLHPFEPDADGDCRRCEFGADETEVHVPAGETIIGFIDPSGKGEGNWAESEWQKLRDLGYDETELRAAAGDR